MVSMEIISKLVSLKVRTLQQSSQNALGAVGALGSSAWRGHALLSPADVLESTKTPESGGPARATLEPLSGSCLLSSVPLLQLIPVIWELSFLIKQNKTEKPLCCGKF